MRVSSKSIYALTALIDLAMNSQNSTVNLNSISERNRLSFKYLEQTFSLLKKAGIVSSKLGASGGYVLERLPKHLTIKEIFEATQGNLNSANKTKPDDLIHLCIEKAIFKVLDENVTNILSGITLRDLVEVYRNESEKNITMFYI